MRETRRKAEQNRDRIKEENPRRKPIYLLNKEGKVVKWYRGLNIMCKAANCSSETLVRCLKEGRKFRQFTLTRNPPEDFDPTTFPPETYKIFSATHAA